MSKDIKIDSSYEDGYIVLRANGEVATRINIEGDDEEGVLLWSALYALMEDFNILPEKIRKNVMMIVFFLAKNHVTCINDLEEVDPSAIHTRLLVQTFKEWMNIKERQDNNRRPLKKYRKYPKK